MTTKDSANLIDLSLTDDYEQFLRKLWSDCKVRDWKVYSTETFRKFWNVHVVGYRA